MTRSRSRGTSSRSTEREEREPDTRPVWDTLSSVPHENIRELWKGLIVRHTLCLIEGKK